MLLQIVHPNDRARIARARLTPRVPRNPGPDMPTPNQTESQRAGLCAACRHAEVIVSNRGARFYRCRRSDTDPRFPKYPTLPVLVCRGYEAREA
jgi:hypothetical protein